MTKIETYETIRAILFLIITISTIVSFGVANTVKNDCWFLMIVCLIYIVAIGLIESIDYLFKKKIDKYKINNAGNISLDCSQL